VIVGAWERNLSRLKLGIDGSSILAALEPASQLQRQHILLVRARQ
jgi:hypothetical protein